MGSLPADTWSAVVRVSAGAVAELSRQYPPPHEFAVVDVSSDTEVRAWAECVLAGGPPDLLINNAGLINRNAPLWKVPEEEFSRVVDVNIKGVVNVLRHFLPAMVKRGQGVIVNLSSGSGRGVSPEVAPYCATKWAIEGLTRALAEELPAGMAAVPLNPGLINTDMLQTCWGKGANNYPDASDWAQRRADAAAAGAQAQRPAALRAQGDWVMLGDMG